MDGSATFVVCAMLTPVVKATKGNQVKEFFNTSDYDKWRTGTATASWKIKYYKGLATSNSKEAKEYFARMKTLDYICSEQTDHDAILKAFEKGASCCDRLAPRGALSTVTMT